MLNTRIKIVKLLALILVAILFLTSCNHTSAPSGEITGATSDEPTESESGTVSEPGEEKKEMIRLFKEGSTDYTIINGMTTVSANAMVRNFAENLKAKTGVELTIGSPDTAKADAEFLIGKITTREESQKIYETMPYSAYSIRIVGKKICFNSYSEFMLDKMLKLFVEALTPMADGGWGIAADYRLERDLSTVTAAVPTFSAGTDRLRGVTSCGEGNYMATFEKISSGEYQNYTALLKSNGYTLYASNELAGNQFCTWLKGQTQINLSWYPSKKIFKLIYGEKAYLPALEQPATEAVCTPSITQLGRKAVDESAPNGAPGMSYVIQLSNGSYIIIDGGPVDSEGKDVQQLLDFLIEHKPENVGKPQIAAWFITHAHIDHTQLASEFLKQHHDKVDLLMTAYNFPDFSTTTITHESASGMGAQASSFKTLVRAHFRGAQNLILHTGQKFWIGDARIEVLYTPEDFAPVQFPWGNHTSCAFRITLGGKSIMILGDCEKELCQFMADVYGNTLKSDILQCSHHGVNGACLDLYRAIDPDICFWAIDEGRFLTHSQIRGDSAFDFNKWILNNSVKSRKHYHASATTTIFLD